MTENEIFLGGDRKHILEGQFSSWDAQIEDNWKKVGSYFFKMKLWNQIDRMGNSVDKHEKSKALSAILPGDVSYKEERDFYILEPLLRHD